MLQTLHYIHYKHYLINLHPHHCRLFYLYLMDRENRCQLICQNYTALPSPSFLIHQQASGTSSLTAWLSYLLPSLSRRSIKERLLLWMSWEPWEILCRGTGSIRNKVAGHFFGLREMRAEVRPACGDSDMPQTRGSAALLTQLLPCSLTSLLESPSKWDLPSVPDHDWKLQL